MTYLKLLFVIYVATIVLMSLISFALFCHDKKLAENQKMRIKEKTLLGVTVLNGAIGSFVGRKVAHHKTDKSYFSITIYFGLLCQIGVGVLLAVLAFVI